MMDLDARWNAAQEADRRRLAALNHLVVDDSRYVRELIRRFLSAYGMQQVEEASEGAQALEILESGVIDVLLVDNEMPMLSGVEITRIVRRSKGGRINPEMPIIMVSGRRDEKAVLEAVNAGVHEFVAKPFAAAMLYERVRSAVLVPREFIRTPAYIGPDRRRRNLPPPPEEDRRKH